MKTQAQLPSRHHFKVKRIFRKWAAPSYNETKLLKANHSQNSSQSPGLKTPSNHYALKLQEIKVTFSLQERRSSKIRNQTLRQRRTELSLRVSQSQRTKMWSLLSREDQVNQRNPGKLKTLNSQLDYQKKPRKVKALTFRDILKLKFKNSFRAARVPFSGTNWFPSPSSATSSTSTKFRWQPHLLLKIMSIGISHSIKSFKSYYKSFQQTMN